MDLIQNNHVHNIKFFEGNHHCYDLVVCPLKEKKKTDKDNEKEHHKKFNSLIMKICNKSNTYDKRNYHFRDKICH